MKVLLCCQIFLGFISINLFAQSIDEPLSQVAMKSEFEVFKNIRIEANSGLYKYRTKEQIDSIYQWAEQEIEQSSTHLDFYNIICHLTDFEGSSHNATRFSDEQMSILRLEKDGYFPYPIKWIAGNWVINYENDDIAHGSEIVSINGIPMSEIIANVSKYYTTDGVSKTGKRLAIRTHFARYFRYNYGRQEKFNVAYKIYGSNSIERKTLESVSSSQYYKNFNTRYSKPFDEIYYKDLEENEKYTYKQIDSSTGILTVYTFSMGGPKSKKHQKYLTFLDSVFNNIKTTNTENLVVDIRNNGGGTDPNDLVTYSYLTQREFQENTQAWISFKKIPYLKYVLTKVPRFLRPIGVFFTGHNRSFKNDFPEERQGKYFQNDTSNDHKVWKPQQNAFNGNIYLLINPGVGSAASLFGAMVAGDINSTVIGEESAGGYYGHNGHTPLGYILPQSKIRTIFSAVNLEQDVPTKSNQRYNRGIIPDYDVPQSHEDYLNQRDTQMDFVLELIQGKGAVKKIK